MVKSLTKQYINYFVNENLNQVIKIIYNDVISKEQWERMVQ